MANDYSLDPLELEEQQLKERQLRAQAAGLRLTGNSIIDAGLATGDRVKSLFDQKFIDDDRKALGAKADAQMEASLQGVDPRIANLLRNPRTRATGEALLQTSEKRRMDREDDERQGISGGGVPSYETAYRWAASNDKDRAARGAAILKLYEGHDPAKNVRLDPQGRAGPIPGQPGQPNLVDQYVEQEQRKAGAKVEGADSIVEIPYNGGTWKGARSAVPPELRNLVPALRQAPATAGTPPATLPPTPTGNPPIQAPNPSSEVNSGVGGTLSGAVGALNEGSIHDRMLLAESGNRHTNPDGSIVTSPKGAQGAAQIMPSTGRDPGYGVQPVRDGSEGENRRMGKDYMNAMLQQFNGNEAMAAAAYNAGPERVRAAVAQHGPQNWLMAMPEETKQYVAKVAARSPAAQAAMRDMHAEAGGQPPAPAPAPTALGNSVAATNGVTAPRPIPPPGVADPQGAKIHEEGVKTSEGIYKTGQEKATVPGASTLDALNTADEALKNPSFFGTGGTALNNATQAIGSFFGMPSSNKAVNTDRLEGLYKNLSVATLRDYGSSQSLTDMDLRENAKRYPDVLKDPVLQKELIDRHKEIIMISHKLDQQVSREMQQSRTTGAPIDPVQRKNELYMEYVQNKWRDKGNPTPAGGANTLPGAVASQAEIDEANSPPGSVFGKVRPARINRPPDNETGIGKFLADRPFTDLSNSVKTLPRALTSLDAAWDSGMNMGEGIRQAVGLGNYEQWSKVKDEQDARRKTDPVYNQGREFYDIFKPTNMLAGGGSIAGTALTSGLQSYLEPTKEPSTKIENAIRGTVLGTAAGTVSKVVPSTKLAPSLNAEGSGDKLLAQFPETTKTLTGTQVKQSGKIDATIGKLAGQTEAAHLAQSKALTTDLMTNAGIPGKILSPENIAKGEANLNADFGKWANKLGKAPLDSTEGIALSGTLKSVANEATPTLNAIIEPLSTGKIRSMSVDTLQKAWNEVALTGSPKATQDAVRAAIEKQMAKAGDLKGFYVLAERSRAIQDIKRVWKGGGQEGQAEASGYLSPAKIVAEAERGPWEAGHMEAAARFVNRFNLRNYRELHPDASVTGAVGDFIGASAGKLLEKGDFTGRMLSKGPKTKFITEMLRAGTARAPEQWLHPSE
jgi:hypothetical protein